MKVGIIRCMQTEDYCPASTDIACIANKTGVFEGVPGTVQLIGINSCGGCPGKKAVLRAREMVRRGADTIVFASCISKGLPVGIPCPFAKKMIASVADDLGDAITILDYTH